MIVNLLGVEESEISDSDLINLHLPRNNCSKEVIWLVGSYVGEDWNCLVIRSAGMLSEDKFFGFLKFEYKMDQLGARLPLDQIPGLL